MTIDNVALKIYPNPVKEQLTVKNEQLSEGSVIEIYDAAGKLQKSKIVNLQSAIVIDVSHLSSGIYFLKAGDNTVKFVKE